MKQPKTNIRSFRFSDRVNEILTGFEGDSLNARFENLVLYCFDQAPLAKANLERIEEDIVRKQQEYWKLCSQLREVHDLIETLERVMYYGQMAERKAKQISEGAVCNTKASPGSHRQRA